MSIHQADTVFTPGTYVASVVALVSGISFNEWVALGGLLLGMATFAVNWYYRAKQDKRDQMRMRRKTD